MGREAGRTPSRRPLAPLTPRATGPRRAREREREREQERERERVKRQQLKKREMLARGSETPRTRARRRSEEREARADDDAAAADDGGDKEEGDGGDESVRGAATPVRARRTPSRRAAETQTTPAGQRSGRAQRQRHQMRSSAIARVSASEVENPSPISVDFDQHKIEVRSGKKSRRESLRFSTPKIPEKVRGKDLRPKFQPLWKMLSKRGWRAFNTKDGFFYAKPHVKNRQAGASNVDMWLGPNPLLDHLAEKMHESYYDIFGEFYAKFPDELNNASLPESEGDSTPTHELLNSALEAEAAAMSARKAAASSASNKTRSLPAHHLSKRRRRSSGGHWAPAGTMGKSDEDDDDDENDEDDDRLGVDRTRRRRSLQGKPSPGSEEQDIGTWVWPQLQAEGWSHANGDAFNSFCYLMPNIANKSKGTKNKNMFMGERMLGRYVLQHRPDLVDAWREEKEEASRQDMARANKRSNTVKKTKKRKRRKEMERMRREGKDELDNFNFARDVTFQMLWPNVLQREMGWVYFPHNGLEAAWAYALPGVKKSEAVLGQTMWTDEDEIVELVKQDPEMAARAEAIIRRQISRQAGLADTTAAIERDLAAQRSQSERQGGSSERRSSNNPQTLKRNKQTQNLRKMKTKMTQNRQMLQDHQQQDKERFQRHRTVSPLSEQHDEVSRDSMHSHPYQTKKLPLAKARKRYPLTAQASFQDLWSVLRNRLGWGFIPYSGIEGSWLYLMPGVTRRADGSMGVNMWCRENVMHEHVLCTQSIAKQVEDIFEEDVRNARLEEEHRRDQEAARARAQEQREKERKLQKEAREAQKRKEAENKRRQVLKANKRKQRNAALRAELKDKLQARLMDKASFNDIWNFLRYDCHWKYFPWSGLENSFAYALPDVPRASDGKIGHDMWLEESAVVKYVRAHPTWLDRCEMHLREVLCEEYAEKIGVDNLEGIFGEDTDFLVSGPQPASTRENNEDDSGSALQSEDEQENEENSLDGDHEVGSDDHHHDEDDDASDNEEEDNQTASSDMDVADEGEDEDEENLPPLPRKVRERTNAEEGESEDDLSRADPSLRERATKVFETSDFASIWNILKTSGWRWFPGSGLEDFMYAMPHVKQKRQGVVGKDLFQTEQDVMNLVRTDARLRKTCIDFLYDVLWGKQKMDDEKDREMMDDYSDADDEDEDEDDDNEEEDVMDDEEDENEDEENSQPDSEMNSAFHAHVVEKAGQEELWEILQEQFGWRGVEDHDAALQTTFIKPSDKYGDADERFDLKSAVMDHIISNPTLRRDVSQEILQRWRDSNDKRLGEIQGWEIVLKQAVGKFRRGKVSQKVNKASFVAGRGRKFAQTRRRHSEGQFKRSTRRQSHGTRRRSLEGFATASDNEIDDVDEASADSSKNAHDDENDILASATFNQVWHVLRLMSWQYFPYSGLEGSWRYALPSVKKSSEGTLGVNMWVKEDDLLDYVKRTPDVAEAVRRRLEEEASPMSSSNDSESDEEDVASDADDEEDHDGESHHAGNDNQSDHDILETATFNDIWGILRNLSWQYFPYSGLEGSWRYALPEVKKSSEGTLGVDMWVREEEVLDYVKRTPRYANEVRRQLEAAATSGISEGAASESSDDDDEVEVGGENTGDVDQSDADSDDDDEEEEEEGDEEEDEAESENERVSFAQLSRKELWPRLREEGWHYKIGRGLVSHYYLAPNVATVEDGILGETVFDSEDALYNHFQNLREPRKASAAATSPVSQSVLEMWSAMMGRGWRQVDNLFISPDAKPVREGPRDLAVFKEDHCTVFRSMRRAVSNFIMKNKSSPTSSVIRGKKRRRSEVQREDSVRQRRTGSNELDDEDVDEIDDEDDEELPEEISEDNFWDDVWPCLAKRGWKRTRRRTKGLTRPQRGFRAPLGVSGSTLFSRVSEVCKFLREQRETLGGGEGASHNDNDNSDGEDRSNSDSEDDEEENEKADALRKFNEYMQTLRDEQPRPANFFRDFFPMLREAGWTYKYGTGIDTEIFLAPGIKRISDGVRGETVIPSQASMCEWIKLNRGAIQQSLHRALLTTPSDEKVTSSDGALSGVDPGRAGDTFGDKGAESSSEAGDVEAMELASAAGESDVDVDAAAPERSGVNETQDGTDGDDAIRPRLCDDENKVMKAPRYEHPSGSHLHDEFEEVLAATSELKLRWPGREEQIDVLAGIMTPRHLLTSHLVLHGDTATGKSGVIRALLNALNYPFAAVDCEECYTPTILFQRLISQMPAPIETGDAGNFMDLADAEAENADEGGDEHDADDADAEDSYIARKNRNVAENRAVLESLGIVLSPEGQNAQGRQMSSDSENVVPTSMDIADNEVVPETGEASVVSVGASAISEARKRWQLAPERCGSMREFMLDISRRFRPSREAKETFYLLLENVSRLEDLGPKFLPALLRIERTTGCNICVVLTTSELPGPMSLALRNASTCFVEFPAYSQMEQRKILMMQLGARAGKAYSEGDVRSFVAVALQTFSSQVRDLREMSRICSDLWDALVKRSGSLGNPQTAFRVALEGRVGLTFKMLYHHDFELDPRAENPSGHTLERWERDEIKRAADLPYDSKVVLLASFLGSYNSPEHDRTLFGHARKLSKQQKYGSAATSRKLAGASAGQLLLGPKVFNLERLVNLYRALEGMLEASASRPGDEAQGASGKRRPTRQLNKQVASLISAGLLTRVSRAEDLDLVKLKCTVPFDFAQALAETVKLDLAELLEA